MVTRTALSDGTGLTVGPAALAVRLRAAWAEFHRRELAVAVLIVSEQNLRGGGDLSGGKQAVVIGVEEGERAVGRSRSVCAGAGLPGVAGAAVLGGEGLLRPLAGGLILVITWRGGLGQHIGRGGGEANGADGEGEGGGFHRGRLD